MPSQHCKIKTVTPKQHRAWEPHHGFECQTLKFPPWSWTRLEGSPDSLSIAGGMLCETKQSKASYYFSIFCGLEQTQQNTFPWNFSGFSLIVVNDSCEECYLSNMGGREYYYQLRVQWCRICHLDSPFSQKDASLPRCNMPKAGSRIGSDSLTFFSLSRLSKVFLDPNRWKN